jgi:heavy metal translocating P-type ATPase
VWGIGGDKMKKKYDITGMSCSACSAHVEKSVKKIEGVKSVNVNLLTNSMQVDFDEKNVGSDDIIKAVESGGYGASEAGKNTQNTSTATSADTEIKQMKKRLIVSFCFMIPLFYVAMGHMAGWPLPGIIAGQENIMVFALTELLLTLPIMYVNRKYYTNGFKSLFTGAPNMDSLVAIGSGAAVLYSFIAMFKMGYFLGHGMMNEAHNEVMELYFESAGMILALITLGKFLETRSKGKTSEAVKKLIDLAPKKAYVIRNGVETEIPADKITVGDLIVVKPGAGIPADGTVEEGSSFVDESAITGESIPVEKTKGSKVVCATINKNGSFVFKAEKTGDDTTLSQIVHLVEEAGGSKAPIAKLADKVAGVFVPTVISIAVVAAIVWLFAGMGINFAVSIGIAVLVISCPCALGLATPTAIMVGTGKGAQNGILIKSAESLETAHLIDTVILDKTGTITEGKPKVAGVYSSIDEKELFYIAASAEKKSEHPLSAAIVEKADKMGISLSTGSDFEAISGRGIKCTVDGKNIIAGNKELMSENGISDTKMFEKADEFSSKGQTSLLFASDNKIIGIISVADTVKETSKEAIEEFKKAKMSVYMMTGDNGKTAKAIADEVGIKNVFAGVMPQDKEEKVRFLQSEGRKVAMVGDGINDAPALARADVGIAIGAGTDIAIESADIVLVKNDLLSAAAAFELSKATIRNIKENLFWAFIYNIIGIPVAAGIFYPFFGLKLNPMIGAAAMSMSSVFVVSNALRLRGFTPSFMKGKKANKNAEPNNNEKLEGLKEENEMEKTIMINGMMCSHCTGRVQKALTDLGAKADVSLDEKCAHVTVNDSITDDMLKKAVEDAGYEVTGIK